MGYIKKKNEKAIQYFASVFISRSWFYWRFLLPSLHMTIFPKISSIKIHKLFYNYKWHFKRKMKLR